MLTYRPDIDGLRAIAVLSVVAFHLVLPGFAGGYIGVDVFFVISGYLITGIITRDLEAGRFSLSHFYLRRIRRLLPAVIATVAVTTVGAALVMTPYDLVAYGRSALAALVSLSNLVFYAESGYWDTASELKPLLHTWSLAVEEQFYLFWPALLLCLFAGSRKASAWRWLLAISLAGIGLCVYYSYQDVSAAFYLLPFRVFQFSLGALVIPLGRWLFAAKGRAWAGNLCFWPGLALIAASVHALGEGVLFPGWVVLLPTLGTMLVLLAGAAPGGLGLLPALLMQNRVSLWFGKVSYSLYLVHWPVISLWRYRWGTELSASDQLLLALAMLPCTLLLHYGVEYRFYSRTTVDSGRPAVSPGQFARRIALVAGLVALAPLSAWQGSGWTWRYTDLALTPEQVQQGKQARFDHVRRACRVDSAPGSDLCRPDADRQVLLLGNSHEPDGYNFLQSVYGQDENLNLVIFGTTNRCRDLTVGVGAMSSSDEDCQARLDALMDPAFTAHLDLVFYAANRPFAANKAELLAMIRALRAANPAVKVVVLGGYVNTREECARYIAEQGTPEACADPERVVYFAGQPQDQPLYNAFMAVTDLYIDRVDLLCKNRVLQTCRMRTEEGIPAFYDAHHHSLEFAEMTGLLYERAHPGWLPRLLAEGEASIAGASTR